MSKNFLKLKNTLPPLPNPHFEPVIELISNREATVEGCSGVIEYTDTIVQVNCRSFVLTFNGFNLSIKSSSKDIITVTGQISDISFSLQ